MDVEQDERWQVCVMCEELTLGTLANGTPICWRPCYHLLLVRGSTMSVACPERGQFILGSLWSLLASDMYDEFLLERVS